MTEEAPKLPEPPEELVSYFNGDRATCSRMEELIREYARQAVLMERERCAKVCEGLEASAPTWSHRYRDCAAAIRKGEPDMGIPTSGA